MEKEKKISIGLTVSAIVLILLIGGIYIIKNNTAERNSGNDVSVETGQPAGEQVDAGSAGKADEKGQDGVSAESAEETGAGADSYFIYTDELPDIMGKPAEELYTEAFSCTEDGNSSVRYYIKDGTLFFDECVAKYDEEGMAVYEWKGEEKIADDVIYVDYNSYYGTSPLAVYITENHVLRGNYGFGYCEEIYLENIQYARAYAEQIIALGTDGSLWCLGRSYSISDGRKLVYNNWQKVLENVVYASLGHYNYMAVTSDGSLYMWGDNTYGQFGDGSLLKEDTGFKPDCYFYPEPIKVADNVKMVWQGKPGLQYDSEYEGPLYLRSYILTSEDELYVCGEAVDDEIRKFSWYGELGDVKEFYAAQGEDREYVEVNCTSRLYLVK
ncbi:MAG: hypothetical protein IJ409_03325 [Lachnospiraceae bacterium]|nr:hypothetical protein [Lachnospiraceae bacterium]